MKVEFLCGLQKLQGAVYVGLQALCPCSVFIGGGEGSPRLSVWQMVVVNVHF